MEFLVHSFPLWQDCTEISKSCFCLLRPLKWLESGGEASERSCNLAVIMNKPFLKVGKTEKELEMLTRDYQL